MRGLFTLMRRLLPVLLLAVTGVVVGSGAGSGAVGGATVSPCTAASHLTATVAGLNGAATQYYFLVAFKNSGVDACSLTDVPRAQPVVGTARSPVGPATAYRAVAGVTRRTVVLRPRDGKAYVEYAVVMDSDRPTSQCKPARANGVVLRPRGSGSSYFPIRRCGSTEVCTKLSSTRIGAFSSISY